MPTFSLSDGITLREFAPEDAAAVFETVTRNYDHLKVFMHWASAEYSLSDAREFIGRSLDDRADRKDLSFGIFREGKFIGSIGFVNFDWLAMKTEIGYWIDHAEEGKGIVSSACRRLLDFAFDELKMNRIEIRCAADNLRSAAVPRRLGFKCEGRLRQSEFRNGRLHDFEIYGLLASERGK